MLGLRHQAPAFIVLKGRRGEEGIAVVVVGQFQGCACQAWCFSTGPNGECIAGVEQSR